MERKRGPAIVKSKVVMRGDFKINKMVGGQWEECTYTPVPEKGGPGLFCLCLFSCRSLIFRLCNPEIFDTPQITCVCFPDVRI